MRKKLFAVMICGLMLLSAGIPAFAGQTTEGAAAGIDLETAVGGNLDEVTADFLLPASSGAVTFHWKTSRPETVLLSGTRAIVARGLVDRQVVLKVTAMKRGETDAVREFHLTVPAYAPQTAYLEEGFEGLLDDGLPMTKLADGSNAWRRQGDLKEADMKAARKMSVTELPDGGHVMEIKQTAADKSAFFLHGHFDLPEQASGKTVIEYDYRALQIGLETGDGSEAWFSESQSSTFDSGQFARIVPRKDATGNDVLQVSGKTSSMDVPFEKNVWHKIHFISDVSETGSSAEAPLVFDLYVDGVKVKSGIQSKADGVKYVRKLQFGTANATVYHVQIDNVKAYAFPEQWAGSAMDASEQAASAFLAANTPEAVSGDLSLPEAPAGASVEWISAAPEIVSATGTVTKPVRKSPVAFYSVTRQNGTAAIRAFPLTVLPKDTPLFRAQQDLEAISLPKAAVESLTLPETGAVNGSAVTWSTSSPAIAADGAVTRGDADQFVLLTASAGGAATRQFRILVPRTAPEEAAAAAVDDAFTRTGVEGGTPHNGETIICAADGRVGYVKFDTAAIRDPFDGMSTRYYLQLTTSGDKNNGGAGNRAGVFGLTGELRNNWNQETLTYDESAKSEIGLWNYFENKLGVWQVNQKNTALRMDVTDYIEALPADGIAAFKIMADAGTFLFHSLETSAGEECKPQLVAVRSYDENFEIERPGFYALDRELLNAPAGPVTVKTSFSNDGPEQRLTFAAAVYQGGCLKEIETKEVTIPAGQTTETQITVTVPDAAGCRIRAMVWKDNDTLSPLLGSVSISSPQ